MADRTVIVTGGTGALGRCIAQRFAMEGYKVYIPSLTLEEFSAVFDRSQAENDEAEFKLKKIFSFVCNATDENSVAEFVRSVAALENGKIDALINTVGGIHPNTDISDFSTGEFDRNFNLNFKSAFFFTREVLKVMKPNNYGRIVSLGAIAGLETTPKRLAYSVSKAAVINLMNIVSEEMKDFNIRANTVVPGIMDTPANREWGSEEDIKKWVKTEDVALVCYRIASDEFSDVRGSVIKLYGNY